MCSKYVTGNDGAFVTSGVKHIKFWNLENGKLNSKEGTFKKFPIQTIVSVDFTAKVLFSLHKSNSMKGTND